MALRLLISDAVWAEVESVLRDLNHAAGSPRSSATGYSSKPSSPKRAPAYLGATCPRRSGTGLPSPSVSADGKRAPSGNGCGSGDTPARTNDSRNSSSIRPLCGLIRREGQQNGGQHAQALGRSRRELSSKRHVGLPRRPHRRLVRADRGRAPRHGGIRASVAEAAGGDSGAGVMDKALTAKPSVTFWGCLGNEAVIPPGPAPECSYQGRIVLRRL